MPWLSIKLITFRKVKDFNNIKYTNKLKINKWSEKACDYSSLAMVRHFWYLENVGKTSLISTMMYDT